MVDFFAIAVPFFLLGILVVLARIARAIETLEPRA